LWKKNINVSTDRKTTELTTTHIYHNKTAKI
jgi:hypothetical protein